MKKFVGREIREEGRSIIERSNVPVWDLLEEKRKSNDFFFFFFFFFFLGVYSLTKLHNGFAALNGFQNPRSFYQRIDSDGLGLAHFIIVITD